MNKILVISVISDDKPGIVEALAKVISEHGGNWQESRMAHMAGKFAGILQVSVSADNADALCRALDEVPDMRLLVDRVESQSETPTTQTTQSFSAIGNDRPGIVREIAQAFSSRQINLDELHTDYTTAPYSGEALFRAQGDIHVPDQVDNDELKEQLEAIADELGIDIELAASAD